MGKMPKKATFSPPSSRPSSPSLSSPASLDSLLERYLHLLDEYMILREHLSKDLSSGFFSLAQANFNAPSHIRHYGQDLYDERMQAILRVERNQSHPGTISFTPKVLPTSSSSKRKTETALTEEKPQEAADPLPAPSSGSSAEALNPTPTSKEEPIQEPTQIPTPSPSNASSPSPSPLTPTTSTPSQAEGTIASTTAGTPPSTSRPQEPSSPSSSSSSPPADAATDAEQAPTPLPDPIRQFGVLVPPSLRAAQASFQHGVRSWIFELVRVDREMAVLEGKIGEARGSE